MDLVYVLACGIVWRKTSDPEAGWELVEALKSTDPCQRLLAQSLLVENGEGAMELLASALAGGLVSPEAAGPCMAELLRGGHVGQTGEEAVKQHLGDEWLC